MIKKIRLKAARESSLLRRHPWVFSGAINAIEGAPQPGETISLYSHKGEKLALGAYSPHSQISVRIWSFDIHETIDADFFSRRLQQAIQARSHILHQTDRTACRLVNGEADGLPGLIIDRYQDYLVLQSLFTGIEYWKPVIVEQLASLFPCRGIYERSDTSSRAKEKLNPATGLLYGAPPDDRVKIREHNADYWVDIYHGHKTGFYLDQHDNRTLAASYCANKTVLNCFSYSGSFGIHALLAGATHVYNVDSSKTALDLAQENAILNRIAPARMTNIIGNVFEILREYQQTDQRFDIIILDPPKFAETKSQLNRAARAYKDINLQGFKLLKPGGLLITFSCSGAIEAGLFQKIVADAALDAKREARIIKYLTQAEDHPVALTTPEGSYLKGLICKV